jgi:hypothetical protein
MANPFVHIELNTGDVGRARSFYKNLFKWSLSLMPGMPYTVIDVGTKNGVGGGMQTKPMPNSPTGWLAYVQVDDVKTTVAKAKKLGAQIMVPYQTIPGMGAMGIFVDPTGGVLGVWQPDMKPARRAAKPTRSVKAGQATKKVTHRNSSRKTTRR